MPPGSRRQIALFTELDHEAVFTTVASNIAKRFFPAVQGIDL
jgi:hypothetical protein